jgi:hypothetical protein
LAVARAEALAAQLREWVLSRMPEHDACGELTFVNSKITYALYLTSSGASAKSDRSAEQLSVAGVQTSPYNICTTLDSALKNKYCYLF